jgi:two-component system, NarL family, sensor histidine kinase UhpB
MKWRTTGAAGNCEVFVDSILSASARYRPQSHKLGPVAVNAPETLALLRALFNPSPDAVCITLNDRIVFSNTAFAALFEVTLRDGLRGMKIYRLLPAALHQELLRQGQRALNDESPVASVPQELTLNDGATRQLTWVTSALPELGDGVLKRVLSDVTEQAQERLAWDRARQELQRLSTNQVDAREAERRHIAREMHDELGQRLTALKIELASLARQRSNGKEHPYDSDSDNDNHANSLSESASDERISGMLGMVDDTIASVRRIASDLRPMMLDDLGLNPAIQWLVRESAQRTGIQFSLSLETAVLPNEHQLVIAIYRIVQEALTNVARHAHATRAHVETRRFGDELHVVVSDNGCGFSAQAMNRDDSHGLMGIRERTLSLGGHFEIGNLPAGGARIGIRLPLQLTKGRHKILTERRVQKPDVQLDERDLRAHRKRSAVELAFDRAVRQLQSLRVKD